MAKKCKDSLTFVSKKDGSEAEGLFALPLVGGESYQLDITPTPPPPVYKGYQRPDFSSHSDAIDTQRHMYSGLYGDGEFD